MKLVKTILLALLLSPIAQADDLRDIRNSLQQIELEQQTQTLIMIYKNAEQYDAALCKRMKEDYDYWNKCKDDVGKSWQKICIEKLKDSRMDYVMHCRDN